MSSGHRTPRRGTALGRPIDLAYPSNRLALAGGAAVGLVTGAAMLANGEFALARPFWTGVAAFLAWAITRELAPDHPWAAAAAIAACGVIAAWGQPAVGLAVVSLLAVRVWAGTVGHHPSVIDLVAGLAIAAYVGGRPILWIPALAFGAGIVVAARHRVEASAAVATGVAIAVVFAMMSDATVEVDVSAAEITAIAALAAATALAVPIRSVASATDRRSLPISPGRVSAAWLVGLAVVIATAALGRLSDGAALIAAMSSAAPVHLSAKLGPRRGV